MAKQLQPGDIAYEMLCIPSGCTLADVDVFSNGSDVTNSMAITGPTLVAGGANAHAVYRISMEVPDDAADRQVYTMIVHWKDLSGDLQCPFMFDIQAMASTGAVDAIEIIAS